MAFGVLNKRELRQLKKWVNSPVHNEHSDVQKLFEFLFTRYSLNETTLKKERAWKYINSGESYNDLKMRHLMSYALVVLEDFFRYQELKKDKLSSHQFLIKGFSEKKLLPLTTKALKKAEKDSKKIYPKDENYYYNQYALEVLKFDVEGTQNRTRKTNIEEITTSASLFFMMTTLRYAYTALSQKSLKKEDYRIPLLEGVLVEIEENDYMEYPILMIWYYGFQTLNQPEEEVHFRQLNYYLETESLGKKEQREILLMALNYAIRKVNTRNQFYMQEAFRLYKKGLKDDILIEQNKMSHFTYKNIVSLSIILKEYDWLEYFIPTYATKLKGDLKDNYKDYSLARLTFARGEFDQTMELLIQANYDDIMLNIDSKVLLLKVYYQQGYWDALEALLESFRIFLNRKKELSYHIKNYMTLIFLVKKMLNIANYDTEALKKMTDQIETTNPAEQEWLLEWVKRKSKK